MLALARLVGQEVIIHDGKGGVNVELRVVEIHGDKVRLSFDAPSAIKIDRKEIWESKEKARKELLA